jgi:branched-subunit amino acid aminotransferase/4-amino-4-deoxychorismate lyase
VTDDPGPSCPHAALIDDARQQPQSVLLYVSRPTSSLTDAADWDPEESLFLTETTIANVLFLPCGSAGEPPAADAPFLPGLQRAALLARGEAEERDITLAQAKRWVAAGGRVACANALRGVWDVQVDWQ